MKTLSDSPKQAPLERKDKQGKENKKRCLLCNTGINILKPDDQ